MNTLFSLSLKRSVGQAILFYVVYLIITIAAGAVLGMVLSVAGLGFQEGLYAGAILAILICTGLAIKIKSTHGLQHSGVIVLIIATAVLAFVGGGFLGLIIPAVLTTKGGAAKPATPAPGAAPTGDAPAPPHQSPSADASVDGAGQATTDSE